MKVRRAVAAGAALLACGLAAAGGGAAPTAAVEVGPHTAAKAPSDMIVYAQEWSMYASRASVPAGKISVQLWNRGQDQHDLRIRRVGSRGMYGAVDGAVKVTNSGAISSTSWTLQPGRYELYCSLPGHLMKGMHFEMTVSAT